MKALLRKDIRNKLASLPTASKETQGKAIAAKVLLLPAYSRSKSVGVFLPSHTEVPTDEIVQNLFATGRVCYAPRVLDGNMDLLEVFSMQDLESFPKKQVGHHRTSTHT